MPRLTVLLVLLLIAPALTAIAGGKPAPVLDTEFMERHEAPNRDFDVQHLRLDLHVNLVQRRLAGEAAITLTPLASPQREVVLHAVDLDIKAVEIAGAGTADYDVEPGLLRVALPRAYAPGETLTVRIRYAVTDPPLGLNFIISDEGYKRPLEAWSQGETEENRYWFPSWDFPNDRATSEMLVAVPAGFTAISNGSLESRRENPDGTVTFHWVEHHPNVNYLVSLIVGKFAHIEKRYGSTPIDIYVPPGWEGLAERSFGETPEMMRVFEGAFGPYPYEKYAQTTVFDFRWGGMENASATTLTDRTLHDEAAHLTYRSEDLVAHELAHQWFGDMITCRDWSDAWLNEAFATFAEVVYYQARWGEDGLAEKLLDWRHDYLEEVAKEYRRPIISDNYGEEVDLFDAHMYEKGAMILNMLRNVLGEETFARGLRHYVDKHAWQTVETSQLRVAFEEASGRDLRPFFEQWLYRSGHPILEANWRWNEDEGQVEIEVRQLQQADSPAPLFDTPLDIRVYPSTGAGGSGGPIDHRVRLHQASETFRFPADKRPRIVALDPKGWLLAEIDFQKPVEEWVLEVAEAPEVMGRVAAARALADFIGDPEALAALEKALRTDPSRHVRGQAAESLGEMGTEGALETLAAGLDDRDARVRLKVAEALGEFHSQRAARFALRLIDRDPSPYVVGEAAAALGHTQARGALEGLERAARRTSHDDTIRKGAYEGMAALENADAIPPLLAATRYGLPWRGRGKAIESLGKLAKALPDRRPEIREHLMALIGDRHFDARRAAVVALGNSNDSEALPKLRQLARQHPDSWVRAAARAGVWKILKADQHSDQEMVERLEKMERENRQLREDVERMHERRTRDSAERR